MGLSPGAVAGPGGGTLCHAAERAFAVGALSNSELSELYGAVELSPDQLANPLTAAESGWGPRARALLLRAASGADQRTAQAEILRRAWDLSREKGGYAIMLSASVPVVAAIEPAAELIWFAVDAARTLFGAGRTDEAMAWYRLAKSDSEANEEARGVADALWPLAQIADDKDELTWRSDGLTAWQKSAERSGGNGALMRRRALMVYCVLQALGEPIRPSEWTDQLGAIQTRATAGIDPVPAPDAALWHALGQASEQHQLGLTVLLALLTLGDGSASAAHPLTIIGLDTEDGHQKFGSDAIDFTRTCNLVNMVPPELHATMNTGIVQKNFSVLMPG